MALWSRIVNAFLKRNPDMTQAIEQSCEALSPLALKGRLALLGWRSLAAWAKAHGYGDALALHVVKNWAGRTDRTPHGGLSRALLHDLRETLAQGRTPQDAILAPSVEARCRAVSAGISTAARD